MKAMFLARALVLGTAAALAGGVLNGCASTASQRATGEVIDDAALTARVKTALARDEGVGRALDVNVTTYKGTVQLSGFVDSAQAASRAAEIAQGVEGVRSVKNDLVVAQNGRDSTTGSSRR